MVVDLVRELDRVVEEVSRVAESRRKQLESLGEELARRGLAKAVPLGETERVSNVVGVDGSRARVAVVGSIALYVVKAVAVSAELSPLERLGVVSIDAAVDEDAEGCAEDYMLFLEASLYEEACRTPSTLLIDGPIVDPPRKQLGCSKTFVEDLHGYRATVLRGLVERGSTVVGFVKRLRGCLSGVPAPIAYRYVLRGASRELRLEGSRHLVAIPYLSDVAPRELASLYASMGVEVASYVVLDSRRDAVYRVDVSPPSEVDEALRLLASMPVNDEGVPLYVALAHEACRIPKRLVEVLASRVRQRLRLLA